MHSKLINFNQTFTSSLHFTTHKTLKMSVLTNSKNYKTHNPKMTHYDTKYKNVTVKKAHESII